MDNEAVGNSWPSYEAYFRFVQRQWTATSAIDRNRLRAELTRLIESEGRPVFQGFPMINKIVELRLMGRRHPRASGSFPLDFVP